MTEIPMALSLSDVQGVRPSDAVVAPTDFGLKQAGATLDQVGDVQRQAGRLKIRAQEEVDRKAAEPLLLQLQTANQDALQAEAASYNGTPGFASDQIAKAQERAQRVAGNIQDPGVRSQFTQLANAETQRIGETAIGHEAQVQAAPIREAFLAQQASQVNDATVSAHATFEPERKALYLDHAAGDTDLPAKVGAAYDAAATAAIAKLPPNLQPAAQGEFGARRPKVMADALQYQLDHARAGILAGADGQITTLANTLVTAPAGYDAAVAQLPKIVATLPRGIQDQATHDATGQLAMARIKGLIAAGQGDIAASELKAGKYNDVLSQQQMQSAYASVVGEGPGAIGRATEALQARLALQADVQSRAATGRGTLAPGQLDAYAALLSPEQIAQHNLAAQAADHSFLQHGAVAGMSNAQLAATAAEPFPVVAPGDPNAATLLSDYETRQQAVAAEVKARTNPGQWAFGNTSQTLGGQPLGAAMVGKWKAAMAVAGPAREAALKDYSATMLQVQLQAGFNDRERQIVPPGVAAGLAAQITQAPPEGRMAAMQGVAGIVDALPPTMTLTDGSTVSPRGLMVQQLMAAGLSGPQATAVLDFGGQDKTVALGRVVAADNPNNTPTALGKDEARLAAQVSSALAPYFATTAPLPGGPQMQAGQLPRTVMVARNLMLGGMDMNHAVATAVGDLAGGYQYVDTWRIPSQVAAGSLSIASVGQGRVPSSVTTMSTAGAARLGMGRVFAGLTSKGGDDLYAPETIPGAPAQRRAIHASQVQQSGHWITLPDDSGVVLAIPRADNVWQTVSDKWGRPVHLSWGQLTGVAQGQASPFAAPPPNQITTTTGQPVPAFSRSAAGQALAWSVERQESGGVNGLTSPKGAMGVMQIMPATLARYAPQVGLPVDQARAVNDADYNRRIGQAALFDLTSRYMTGRNSGAGLGLAAAAYNAGEGRLTGYKDSQGVVHPGWLQTIGDPRSGNISLTEWVNRIPIPETRDYVAKVLGRAVDHLQESH